ncbi:hypothetical protein Q0601_10555 [Paracoccus onubensis]|uniref:hypothetical protein n=1 Tax=Paracoccus onubensis TaxID=1675788 RepID=UPI00273091FB|nr:hypothetical protein [Paracoccus onubensis]MDP0927614.1 hypothetical protein [Paracoccus onubensis]
MEPAALAETAIPQTQLDKNRHTLNRERRHENWSMLRLTIPALLIVGVLMVAPLLWLLSMSFVDIEGNYGLGNYRLFFSEPVYVEIFLNTFKIALMVTVISVLMGYPVAYLMSILSAKWAGLMMLAVLVVLDLGTGSHFFMADHSAKKGPDQRDAVMAEPDRAAIDAGA